MCIGQVAGLKLECLNLMLEDLSYSNLADYWHLGMMFGFEDLVKACNQLGAEDPQAFMSTESFAILKATEPTLAASMLQDVCSRLQHSFQEPCLSWVGREDKSVLNVGNSRQKNATTDIQEWEQLLLDLNSEPEV